MLLSCLGTCVQASDCHILNVLAFIQAVPTLSLSQPAGHLFAKDLLSQASFLIWLLPNSLKLLSPCCEYRRCSGACCEDAALASKPCFSWQVTDILAVECWMSTLFLFTIIITVILILQESSLGQVPARCIQVPSMKVTLAQVHVGWLDGGTAVLAFRGTSTAQDGLQDVKIVRHSIDHLQEMFPGTQAHSGTACSMKRILHD